MSETFKDCILVPVDFKPQSLIAVKQSYNLAKLLGVDIYIIHVLEEHGLANVLFGEKNKKEIYQKIEDKLKDFAENVEKESGVKTHYDFFKGRIWNRVIKLSAREEVKYILMGSDADLPDNEKTAHMGINTARVIRNAKCPVFTIKGDSFHNGCRSILLPLDLTKETKQKVTSTIALAKLFKSEIDVISVLWSKKNASVINTLNIQMDQVLEYIKSNGISVTGQFIEVDKEKQNVKAILDFAEKEQNVDLISIMTQQEIGMVEMFLGSTAQEVIRKSQIPVVSFIPQSLGFSHIR